MAPVARKPSDPKASAPKASDGKSFVQRAKPWAIIAALAAAFGLFFAYDLHQLISFETLAAERERLLGWVAENPVLAPLAMVALYALTTLLSLPIAAVMTLGIGFLLGTALAAVVVAIGATLGATGLFLLARSAFGERWRGPVERVLSKLDNGFQENAFQYLLVLRLMPVMPFWLLNIVPAFAGVSLRAYVGATFFGILPGTIVFCSVGAGFSAIFARGEVPGLDVLSNPALILPLAGLAILAAIPLAYRRWRGHQARRAAAAAPTH